jgi:hypothetical protein
MTEEDAKTKWCPFVRVGHAREAGEEAFNRLCDDQGLDGDDFSHVPEAALCIASACMAWRWSTPGTAPADQPERGYCGLAGAQQ